MRDQDVLRQLAALNPVTDTDLARLDAAAGAALREGIVMTAGPPARARRLRAGRRAALSAALAVALLGGGATYAAVQLGWYDQGGGHEGLTCLTAWADPGTVNLDTLGDATGGPPLTGDPVADCQEYRELSGRAPIEDPVAFRWDGPAIYVAPRPQVPPGAEILPVLLEADPVHELSISVDDFVDGLGARCLAVDDYVLAARAELDRLGLSDWQVEIGPRYGEPGAVECASMAVPDAAAPVGGPAGGPQTLVVTPDGGVDRDSLRAAGTAEVVFEVRDALREQITHGCLDLGEAVTVVDEVLGGIDHWPTGRVVDPAADCTRAYMTGGGSIQVTLYGPDPAAG